ncbi:MAG: hypothetical protein C0501_06360 [Isosphaera sp.]|nr:hypothetical protein [Isosphaera sp.]
MPDPTFRRARPLALALLAAAGLLGCKGKKPDPTDPGGPGTPRKADPPVGWSHQEVDLARRGVVRGGPNDPPARMYVGGKPTYLEHGTSGEEYRRLADRVLRKGNTVVNFWAWEDGGRVYSAHRDTAGTTMSPPPKGLALAKFQTDGFVSTAEGRGFTVVSRKEVTHRGWPGIEVVLDGQGLRVAVRVVVIPEAERMYLFQVAAVKQSDPLDADDPKVRAFLDNSEPVAGGEKK